MTGEGLLATKLERGIEVKRFIVRREFDTMPEAVNWFRSMYIGHRISAV